MITEEYLKMIESMPPREALTPKEREVLVLVCDGLSNKLIADRLCMADRTAKFHMDNLMAKLGTRTRAGIVAVAFRKRIVK